jgi:hypothetical protein
MNEPDLLRRIVSDPAIFAGKPKASAAEKISSFHSGKCICP